MNLNHHNHCAWVTLTSALLIGVALVGCETTTVPLTPATNPAANATAEPTAVDSDPIASAPAAAPAPTIQTTSAETPIAETSSAEKPATPPSDGPPTGAATKPLADRTPRRPGEPEKITFDDLIIGMQADIVFRPWMLTDRAKELEGERVIISGFMHGGVEDINKTKEFVLLRNLECKFGPGGQADHLSQVVLKPGTFTRYPGKTTIRVEGTIKLAPFEGPDGNTWYIYRLEDAVMK